MATCVRKIFNERFCSRDMASVLNSVEDDDDDDRNGFPPHSRPPQAGVYGRKTLKAKFASFSFGITKLRLTLGSSREGYVRCSHSVRINISIFVVLVGFRVGFTGSICFVGRVRMRTRRFVPASFRGTKNGEFSRSSREHLI